jgi:hypothetical protein
MRTAVANWLQQRGGHTVGVFSESKARALVVFGLFAFGVFALTGASGFQGHDDPAGPGGDQQEQIGTTSPTHTDVTHTDVKHTDVTHTDVTHTETSGGGDHTGTASDPEDPVAPPTIATTSPGRIDTTSTQPRVTGRGHKGDRVTVTVAGTGCSATVDSSGAWGCTLGAVVSVGERALCATQADTDDHDGDAAEVSAPTCVTLAISAIETSTSTTSTTTTTTTSTTTTTTPPPSTTSTTTTSTTTTPPHHHASPTTPPLTFDFTVEDPGGTTVVNAGVNVGQDIVVTGSNLPPDSRVRVDIHSVVRLLGWTVVGSDGTFRLVTTIPSDLDPGTHSIVVTVYPPTGASAQQVKTIPVGPAPVNQVVLGAFDPGNANPGAVDTPPQASHAPAANGLGDATTFGTSLKTARDIHLTASSIGVIGTLAAAIILLFAFPAEILRLTFVNNYERIERFAAAGKARVRRAAPRLVRDAVAIPAGLRRARRRVGAAAGAVAARFPFLGSDWASVLATAVVGAVILSFADPSFGFHGSSARLLLAMFLSILLVVVTMNTVIRVFAVARFHTQATFKTMPFALLFMVVGVIASRLSHFHPGFVIGLVMGVTYARHLHKKDEATLALVGAGTFFTIGVASWFAFGALPSGAGHEGFWPELLHEVFAAGTLESFVALVVGLLPLTFLEGRPIFEWSRKVWAGVYAVVLVAFMVLIVPISGNFHDSRGNLALLLTGLVAFSAVALAIWYAFRVAERRDREREAATTEPAPSGGPTASRH